MALCLFSCGTWLKRRWPELAVSLILVLYAWAQVRNFQPGYSEEDPDAYAWLAKRMATGQPLTEVQRNPFQFQGHMWVQTAQGVITAKYAPGVPWLMAAAYRAGGYEAMYWVSPIAGGLALLAAYLLFRPWLGAPVSVLATLTVAVNGIFLFQTGYLLTHATELCFVTWGMVFLWRWLARPSAWAGAGAGLSLGFAVTVRHTSVLLAACIVVAVGMVAWRERRALWRLTPAVLALGLAYALFPLLLAAYDQTLFGSPWATGYALSDEQSAFSWAMLRSNLGPMLDKMQTMFLSMLFPFGLFGMLLIGAWGDRTLRLLWVMPLILLYGSYYWYVPNSAFFRFLLSTLPVFAGCAYDLLGRFSGRLRTAAVVLLCLCMVGAGAPTLTQMAKGTLHTSVGEDTTNVGRLWERSLAPDAVVFTRGAFVNCVGQRRQFELYSLEAFNLIDPRHSRWNGQRTFETVKWSVEQAMWGGAQPRRQPSRTEWFHDFYEKATAADLEQWKQRLVMARLEAGRPVAFFVRPGTIERELGRWGTELARTKLAGIECPPRPYSSAVGAWELYAVALKPAKTE